ncbi:hypothetical protein CDAR_191611 [Caerostris darwini]|uniref:Uncharacterized protein n=1 Tax=Caerostris darwini TaxID=1538125 RepID=A0AAV4W510_9ARAC|nr:hypothetical protein CDAR_191601 [Caerostris darwini]GIY77485.1 hypothetical protein CDAR_191611 [Caerostris darwini]
MFCERQNLSIICNKLPPVRSIERHKSIKTVSFLPHFKQRISTLKPPTRSMLFETLYKSLLGSNIPHLQFHSIYSKPSQNSRGLSTADSALQGKPPLEDSFSWNLDRARRGAT